MTQDDDHLKLLAIFHYVLAGLTGLFSLFPLIHLGFGLVVVFAPDKFGNANQPPPPFFGWIFIASAVLFIVVGFTIAILIFFAGRSISKRKRHMFCLVIAGLECAMFPFGTALGVFSLMVLLRESVKQSFDLNAVTPATLP
jgi:hypothetical protein